MAERGLAFRHLALGASVILLASLLQFHHLTRDLRFLPDEAFFMTFARRAAVNGDWLLPGALDKPPLSIYLSALSMAAIGNTADANGVLHLDPHIGEFAGALPNVMLALLLTALMMRLAWRVYRDEIAGLLAGLLSAVSPFMLAFGGSAFTDMSLLFFTTGALYFALSGRWALAGAALGLAFWSKQQAIFVAIFLALLLIRDRAGRCYWLRFFAPLGIICLALLVWDAARPETSIFLQAAANNAPAQLFAMPSAWLSRLHTWLGAGVWLLGPPPVTALLLALAGLAIRRSRSLPTTALSAIFVGALIIYSAIHIVFRFNLYDRYLLLGLPILILLVAGGLVFVCRRIVRFRPEVIVSALLLLSAIWTLNGATPIGGDRAEFSGIDALAAHLNSKPVATVIYDPWLGWELGYYLDAWQNKRRVHYPTANALVEGALALDEVGDRYLVAPVDQPLEDWLAALRDAGFSASPDYLSERFIAYRLSPPASP